MNDANQRTSMTLLQQACADDQDAWGQLVHLYAPLVERWCRKAGLQETDTADVFQETFRTLSRNLTSFRPTRDVGSFRSWLRTIVRTRVADHFRKQKRQLLGQGGSDAHMRMANVPEALEDDTEQEVEAEHAIVVRRAMELIEPEFAPQNWKAFQQVALEGRAATEVAAEMQVSPQAIRQANYRIRRRLRLLLQDLMEEI